MHGFRPAGIASRWLHHTALLSGVLMLAACGGGGSRVGSTPVTPRPTPTAPAPTPTPTPPAPTPTPATFPLAPVPGEFNTLELRRSDGPTQHNAPAVWADGITGDGVTIAVIDTGIDPDSPEFAGRLSLASNDLYATRGQLEGPDDHGTNVALVAAAARDGEGMLGMAWNAGILAIRADEPGTCAGDNPRDPSTECSFLDADIAAGIDLAVANGAKVVNISLGGGSFASSVLRQAVMRAANAGLMIVVAAGNEELAEVDGFVRQMVTAGNGAVVAVGSVDENYQISDFSNRPGIYSQSYLTARGEGVCCSYQDGKIYVDDEGYVYVLSGTSFAAPQVAGAAALLAQAFPNLTGRQIADILLRTAFDAGVAGEDPVYGRGILNVQRAMQPVGTTSLAGTGAALSLTDTGATTSAAMGDAASGLSLQSLITDEYDRAFTADLGPTVHAAAPRSPLHAALAGEQRNLSAGSERTAVAFTVDARPRGIAEVGALTLEPRGAQAARVLAARVATQVSPDTQLGIAYRQGADGLVAQLQGQERPAFMIAGGATGDDGAARWTDASFALRHKLGRFGLTLSGEAGETYSPVAEIRAGELRGQRTHRGYSTVSVALDRDLGDLDAALGLTWMGEDGAMLGAHLHDSFGLAGADSLFVDAAAGWNLAEGWRLGAQWRQGWTHARAGGLVSDGSALVSQGFSFDLSRHGVFAQDDRLALRVSQPLRVQSGGLNLSLPSGFDYSTLTADFATQRLPLAPRGRELAAELAWQGRLLAGNAGASLYYRHQPGHFEQAPADKGLALRWSRSF